MSGVIVVDAESFRSTYLGCDAYIHDHTLLEKPLLMAHLIWPLMAHLWCAINSTPLVIFTNGAPPGAPLVSGILMAHRGCAISIGQRAPLVCLPGAMYTQVLWHTNGAPPLDAPLVTAAY